MRNFLSPDARTALDLLAAEHALLAFDFDGTLAPLVPDRRAARVPASRWSLLRVLSLLYPCAVVSGRRRADVAARVRDIPLFAVVGSYGAEAGLGPRDGARRDLVLSWARILRTELSLVPGIELEDKWFSLAVHYRHVPSRAAGRTLALAAAESLEGARVLAGRGVVNVVPREAPHKGTAIGELLARAGRRPVLYVGDDRSDEDVFRLGSVTVGLRVGRTARSAARWYVPGQAAVDDLLCSLIAARTRRDGLGDRWEGLARAVAGGPGECGRSWTATRRRWPGSGCEPP